MLDMLCVESLSCDEYRWVSSLGDDSTLKLTWSSQLGMDLGKVKSRVVPICRLKMCEAPT